MKNKIFTLLIALGLSSASIAQNADATMAELAAKAMYEQTQKAQAYPWNETLNERKTVENIDNVQHVTQTEIVNKVEETIAERYFRVAQDIRLQLPRSTDRLGAMLKRIGE